jgi:isopentenyl-diphosphate delta-isomerase
MEVILVDEQDVQVGKSEKMEAHKKGLLHRAFSIFIINPDGKLLLQKRADHKYHSGGLWTNACCSHPQPGEDTLEAANRRLIEEMGFSTEIKKAFCFVYKANFENGLIEYEYDHVFIGQYAGAVIPNIEEVSEYCFKSLEEILLEDPAHYTAWFWIALPRVIDHLYLNYHIPQPEK